MKSRKWCQWFLYLQPLQKQPSQHTYRVKIINPHRKNVMMVRHLHHCSSKFDSAVVLRMKLVEKFDKLVPDNLSFNVGYFEGHAAALQDLVGI